MKKSIKILIIALSILIILFTSLFIFLKIDFNFTNDGETQNKYSDVLKRANIKDYTKIIDIALLGAHDAFSNEINQSSKVDPAEKNNLAGNKIVNIFLNGFISRISKAQKADTKTLLNRGVRYFDTRLSYIDDTYYTKHNYISNKFSKNLIEILKFLEENEKEFIILDLQHIYYADKNYNHLIDYIKSVTYNNRNLIDYIKYNPLNTNISSLTYGDVVKNGSGVIILAKNETTKYSYNYDTSILSKWHNKNTYKELKESVDIHLKQIKKIERKTLMVNQYQLTPYTSMSTIYRPLFAISLLDMANKTNSKIIVDANLKEMFVYMPILMVDFANSNKGDFNNLVNELIIEFNSLI